MHRANRKRKVATVTPPDRKGLRTPSPKRPWQNGVDFYDDKADLEVKFVSKCGICFRVIVLNFEAVCLC